MNPLIDSTPYVVDQIRVTIAGLRTAWGWLGELVEPGRDSAPAAVLSDAMRARLDELAAAERADRYAPPVNLPPGARQFASSSAYALPATRAGARIAVVDARARVHALVVDAARMVADQLGTVYVGDRAGDAGVLDALDWLDAPPDRWVATAGGVVWHRRHGGVLDQLRDADAAARVDTALQRALRLARAAARDVDGEHTAPVDGRCPACGRRSLELDFVSVAQLRAGELDERARRAWTVSCLSEACRCIGEGCRCRQKVRYAGRRHAWAYGELAGPYGLWRAMNAAGRRRRGPETRVGSEAAGHGGWAERRVPTRVGRAVRDVDGVLWWDRERACAQVGASAANLRDWVRRSKANPAWPRLDAPHRDGTVSWWRAEQLLDVDEHLAAATRGRRRSA
ncbi:hypothetical protein K1W54_38145 [Micromonospora sp. CPCC 205371]|nr:hypothetical protein [Micromonospora sp. CPCC 205371]